MKADICLVVAKLSGMMSRERAFPPVPEFRTRSTSSADISIGWTLGKML